MEELRNVWNLLFRISLNGFRRFVAPWNWISKHKRPNREKNPDQYAFVPVGQAVIWSDPRRLKFLQHYLAKTKRIASEVKWWKGGLWSPSDAYSFNFYLHSIYCPLLLFWSHSSKKKTKIEKWWMATVSIGDHLCHLYLIGSFCCEEKAFVLSWKSSSMTLRLFESLGLKVSSSR